MSAAHQIELAQNYWDSAAEHYGRDFAETLVGSLWREAIWRELDRVFRPGQRILELNCGTGIDALRLAEKAVSVLGCDISPRMIELARQRAVASTFEKRMTFRVLASEDLNQLASPASFDGAFSNFSGLNCVADLSGVATELARVVRPRATIVLCLLGRLPIWEIAWFLAHGSPRTAFRSRTKCAVVTDGVTVHYWPREKVIRAFAPQFRLRQWKGVGITVPPSYMESWAQRFPRMTRTLAGIDKAIERWPIVRALGGCMLLELEKN